MEILTFRNRKTISSMSELSDIDVKQWIEFLKTEQSEILERSEFYDDFFAGHLYEYDGYVEELYIDEWLWKEDTTTSGLILRDVYGWPGDNQWGAIFLGNTNTIIFTNTDMCLTIYDPKTANYEQNLIVSNVQNVISEFEHLRKSMFLMSDSENGDPLVEEEVATTPESFLENSKVAEKSVYDETKCPICGEGYLDENEMQKLDCLHVFHPECLYRHKKTHCTICGASQDIVNVHYNYDEDLEAGLLEKEANDDLIDVSESGTYVGHYDD